MERFYRNLISHDDLVDFNVTCGTSDLFILADKDLSTHARKLTVYYRKMIEDYISRHPKFKSSLKPLKADPNAPLIINDMIKDSSKAGVGPMASVAGAVAEYVGKDLLKYTSNIIIENGGDIFLATRKSRVVGIYAGESCLSNKIGVRIKAAQSPCGICTSSGTVGHSLSFGKADAVVVFSSSCILADAAATATCNYIKKEEDIGSAIKFAKNIKGIFGLIVVYGSNMGSWGDLEIVNLKI